MGAGYPSPRRSFDGGVPAWESSVLQQRLHNAHIGTGVTKEAFAKIREKRDKTLSVPERMLHVLQMNLRAGRAPEHESDGTAYLKVPLDKF